jgi:hypothetical protein
MSKDLGLQGVEFLSLYGTRPCSLCISGIVLFGLASRVCAKPASPASQHPVL